MHDDLIRAQVHQAVDRYGAHLQPDSLLAQRVMRMERTKTMQSKRKLALILVMALALLLLSATAYAVTRAMLSPRVDAKKLSNQALEQKYGLTSAMLGFFMQDSQGADGRSWRVSYNPSDEMMAQKLGSYLVRVTDGKVSEITWSLEGVSTEGGFDAPAWGAQQLSEMVKITSKTHDFSRFRAKAQGMDVDLYAGMDEPDETPLPADDTVESVLDDPEVVTQLSEEYKAVQEGGRASEAQSRFTRDELIELGRQGIILAYDLDESQQQRLTFHDDPYFFYAYYSTIGADNRPTFNMTFQSWSDSGWQPGDGVYTVVVNVLDGTVEYLDYDTTLDGNG